MESLEAKGKLTTTDINLNISTSKNGLQGQEISNNECAVCLGVFEDLNSDRTHA